jgi:hypothetical protein
VYGTIHSQTYNIPRIAIAIELDDKSIQMLSTHPEKLTVALISATDYDDEETFKENSEMLWTRFDIDVEQIRKVIAEVIL